METATETIPGVPVAQVDPAKSPFIQATLAAIKSAPPAANDKPQPGVLKQAPPKAEEPEEAPVEEAKPEPKLEAKSKINLRKLTKGEQEDETAAEAKPAEAPKTEDVPASIKSTKAAEEFKKLKAERDALKAELAAAKSKPSDDPTKSLLERIQKERDEYSQRLKELDIERHPEFQQKFGKRIESLGNSIKATVGQKGEALLALLKLPDSDYKQAQVDGIIEELSPSQRTKLGGYIAQYEIAHQERQAEIEAAKGSWDQRRAQEAVEAEKAKLRDVEDVEHNWNAALLDAGNLLTFQVHEDDPESKEIVGQRIQEAKQIYLNLNNNKALAYAALAQASMKPLHEAIEALLVREQQYKETIKRLKGASPEIKTQKAADGAPQKKGFVEAVMSQMRR